MVVEKDIVAISIPFSAGVVTAALLPPGSDALWAVAGGSCLAAAGLLCLAFRPGGRTGTFVGLYFLLGLLCSAGAAVSYAPPPEAELAGKALSALTCSIENAAFPHGSTTALLNALLTGRRGGLDRPTVEAFRTAGASHILALSGLHLGILYGILQKGLSILGKSRGALYLRSAAGIGASAFYLAMTGAPPSLVRAFLFICLNEAARLFPGRRRRPLNIFCAALTVQLAVAPAVIRSPGFQLSYLAMLGILLVYPRLEAWYPPGSRRDPVRRIWNGISLTLACQVFTAPLAWIHFHSFPRYFLLTNLGALPLTEAFLLCALPALLPGCPGAIKNLADTLGQILISFLKTVASL
ncbi:MAG: ComEC/Rec2 family competence protein [Bacteroidales bacterium]|nr:ComEC/Rec2 family competence protein [Bacteroidales bacterium]